jgi:hypothetical protein
MSKKMPSTPVTSYLVNWLDQVLNSPTDTLLGQTYSAWDVLRLVAMRASERNWSAFLVGGALRDVAFGLGRREPRDIDIVFSGAQLKELGDEFSDFSFVRNTSLGGLRLKYQDVLLDVWPLEETLAARQSNQPIRIQDIPRYAFLNIEAIAIQVSSIKRSRRVVAESGFSEAVQNATLEINFEHNPFPEICILRAFRSCIALNLSLGNRFTRYVRRRRWDLDQLAEAQDRHYGFRIFSRSHLKGILEIIYSFDHESTKKVDLSKILVDKRDFRGLITLLQNDQKPPEETEERSRV